MNPNFYDCSPPSQSGFPYVPKSSQTESKDLTDDDMDSVQQWIDEQVAKGFLRPAECKTQSQMNTEVHTNPDAVPNTVANGGWRRTVIQGLNAGECPVQTKEEEQEEDRMYAVWAEKTQSQTRSQFLANWRVDRQ
uniref:Uncharacterized protein n=1 Tax=Clandestinovirus TaxID=2831644 RepID=A0A8F8PJX8_9VIRU|nr:hypothetical protein KOM_12_159 [Clandestinovirus]